MQTQVVTGPGHQVRYLMLLQVAPDVFHGIELGRVGRQSLDPQPSPTFTQHLLHRLSTMDRCAIPDHQQASCEMAKQLSKEVSHLRTADRAFVKSEIEPLERQPANQRELVPVERLLNHRRLAARCPGARSVGARTQAAFVDEDDRAAFAARFFLMAGQVRVFHSVIFASLRSTARRVGCWQLMPRERRRCQT